MGWGAVSAGLVVYGGGFGHWQPLVLEVTVELLDFQTAVEPRIGIK